MKHLMCTLIAVVLLSVGATAKPHVCPMAKVPSMASAPMAQMPIATPVFESTTLCSSISRSGVDYTPMVEAQQTSSALLYSSMMSKSRSMRGAQNASFSFHTTVQSAACSAVGATSPYETVSAPRRAPGAGQTGGTGEKEPTIVPLSDAIPMLLIAALLYALIGYRRRKDDQEMAH